MGIVFQIIYSRIARICKNDSGGQLMFKDNWTTFVKARLNCSIPGEYPFYFDEIQGMAYVESEDMVYATFTTPRWVKLTHIAFCLSSIPTVKNFTALLQWIVFSQPYNRLCFPTVMVAATVTVFTTTQSISHMCMHYVQSGVCVCSCLRKLWVNKYVTGNPILLCPFSWQVLFMKTGSIIFSDSVYWFRTM
jgi:hypothetical protein